MAAQHLRSQLVRKPQARTAAPEPPGIFSPQHGVRWWPVPAAPQAGGGRERLRERALVLSDGTTWVLKTAARDEIKF